MGVVEIVEPNRRLLALCWSHARRHFFVLADIASQAKRWPDLAPVISPIALEAVAQTDRIFDIKRAIVGKPEPEQLAARYALSAPLVAQLEAWLRDRRTTLARHTPVAKASC